MIYMLYIYILYIYIYIPVLFDSCLQVHIKLIFMKKVLFFQSSCPNPPFLLTFLFTGRYIPNSWFFYSLFFTRVK